MLEEKKTGKANLDNRRVEIFLVSVVLILSLILTALEWNISVEDKNKDKAWEDLIEDIDFNKLKKEHDMVAAISDTDKPAESSNVKPVEMITQQQLMAPTTSKLVVGDGQSETPEAKVEEVKPQTLESKEELPEGFQTVEQLPEFPGGAMAFMKWITENVKYPKFAQEGKVKGRVVVSFLVDKEGNVQRLRLEKSTNRALGVEVINAMGNMPKWKPGTQNGKPCTAMIAVPINFEL
jgi:protein TonB